MAGKAGKSSSADLLQQATNMRKLYRFRSLTSQ